MTDAVVFAQLQKEGHDHVLAVRQWRWGRHDLHDATAQREGTNRQEEGRTHHSSKNLKLFTLYPTGLKKQKKERQWYISLQE